VCAVYFFYSPHDRSFERDILREIRSERFVRVGAVLASAIAGILAIPGLASASPTRVPRVAVRAVIWPNLVITVAPKVFKKGTVVLKVKNRDSSAQQVEIDGSETQIIEPGETGRMLVTFTKPGFYTFALPDQQQTYAAGYNKAATRVKVT